MKCENCGKNEASYHLRQIINGDCSEKHLCEVCAKGYNYNEMDLVEDLLWGENVALGGGLSQIVTQSIEEKFVEDLIQETLFNDLIMPAYMTTYKPKTESILDQAKKSVINGARAKEKNYIDNPKLKELETLQNEIKQAVENEDYEKALELKKQIDKIKEQGNV